MIGRRHLLIGGACAAAAASAYALEPRKRLALPPAGGLAAAIPNQLPGWDAHDVTDLVAPKEEGSLASRLYADTVSRVYTHRESGAELMMLAAYGEVQSNALMLHRPESCYPAVGFKILSSEPCFLPLGRAELPARQLVAEAPGRREAIVYWTRLGERLPADGRSQRTDRLRSAMSGYVTDGLLVRFSGVDADPQAVFRRIAAIVPLFIAGAPAQQRPVLVGTALARSFA